MFVSGNLVQTNDQILRPVLENAFFAQRLVLPGKPVLAECHLLPHSAMRGLEKIYGEGTDRQTRRHADTHFNTVNRPGLRAGSIENSQNLSKY